MGEIIGAVLWAMVILFINHIEPAQTQVAIGLALLFTLTRCILAIRELPDKIRKPWRD